MTSLFSNLLLSDLKSLTHWSYSLGLGLCSAVLAYWTGITSLASVSPSVSLWSVLNLPRENHASTVTHVVTCRIWGGRYCGGDCHFPFPSSANSLSYRSLGWRDSHSSSSNNVDHGLCISLQPWAEHIYKLNLKAFSVHSRLTKNKGWWLTLAVTNLRSGFLCIK